jgi:hypothetical protein
MKMLPGFQRNRHKKGFLQHRLAAVARDPDSRAVRPARTQAVTSASRPTTDTNTGRKRAARLKERVSLLVAREPSSKHLLSEDAIFRPFCSQLNDFKNVSATSIGDIKRDHAVKASEDERSRERS